MQFPWYFKKSNNICCYMAEMLPIQRAAKTHLSIDHKAINHICKLDGDYLLTLTRVFCWVFLFFFLGFYVPHESDSLWRCRHYRWRTTSCDLHSTLMAIEHWGFYSMPHLLWHGHPFMMVIFEDPLHSHLLPSVWQWSWHYLFLRLRSVAAEIRAPNLPRERERINLIFNERRLLKNLNVLHYRVDWYLYLYDLNDNVPVYFVINLHIYFATALN